MALTRRGIERGKFAKESVAVRLMRSVVPATDFGAVPERRSVFGTVVNPAGRISYLIQEGIVKTSKTKSIGSLSLSEQTREKSISLSNS